MSSRTKMDWKSRIQLPIIDDMIFLDIETSAYGGKVWLIGVLNQMDYRYFYSPNWDMENDMLTDFARYLEEHTSKALVYYSKTNFDIRELWNSAKKHSNEKLLEQLVNRPWIDYLILLARAANSPIRTFSLKKFASHMGYQFIDDSMDGLEVAHHYQSLVSKFGIVDEELVEDLLRYCEDDVRSLTFLVEKFSDHTDFVSSYTRIPEYKRDYNRIKELTIYSNISPSRISYSCLEVNFQELFAIIMSYGIPLPSVYNGRNRVRLTWTSELAIKRFSDILRLLIRASL